MRIQSEQGTIQIKIYIAVDINVNVRSQIPKYLSFS